MERRNISDPEIIKKISTGKIFLGKQALESNLIDKIGSEEDAKEWIDAQLGSSLKIRDINFDRNKLNLPIKILKSDWKREIKNFYKRNSGIMAILPYYSAIGEPSSYID